MKCPKCGAPVCAWCGKASPRLNIYGRPKKYCSKKCKLAAAKQRKRDRQSQTTFDHFNGQERIG